MELREARPYLLVAAEAEAVMEAAIVEPLMLGMEAREGVFQADQVAEERLRIIVIPVETMQLITDARPEVVAHVEALWVHRPVTEMEQVD